MAATTTANTVQPTNAQKFHCCVQIELVGSIPLEYQMYMAICLLIRLHIYVQCSAKNRITLKTSFVLARSALSLDSATMEFK